MRPGDNRHADSYSVLRHCHALAHALDHALALAQALAHALAYHAAAGAVPTGAHHAWAQFTNCDSSPLA